MAKRLIYVANSRIPSERTNSIQVMRMCAAFASVGVETELVIPFRLRDWLRSTFGRSNIWKWYGISNHFQVKSFPAVYPPGQPRMVRYSKAAVRYCLKQNPDLVYTRNIFVAYWLSLNNRPVIFESHDMTHDRATGIFDLFKTLLKSPECCAHIVTISKALAEAYQSAGVPSHRLMILHDGVDLSQFHPMPGKGEARDRLRLGKSWKIVGYTGNMNRTRGVDLLIRAISKLDDVYLVLVGGTSRDLSYLKKLTNDLSLQGRVIFFGYVYPRLIPVFLSAADVLVLTSTSASPIAPYTSPMKMFEYMASGRPIVATDFPTIREVLEHKRNAILVPPESVDSIREGIQTLLNDAALARRIAERAAADVISYEWSNRARAIAERFL